MSGAVPDETEVLVIGSGIAGLTFALKISAYAPVLLITKKERADSTTNYARGGVAAVFGGDDDRNLHVEDTLLAGAGLCHGDVVERVVDEGPDRVNELIAWGTRFDRDGGDLGALALGREGGHSRRRIVHSGDRTGRAIESALLDAVEAAERITVLEDHLAVDLLVGRDSSTGQPRCAGILALDHRQDRLVPIRARATLLATGGCGQVYRHTTNPRIATGDGIAMAYRAGASVSNLEFVQFHPTALYPTEDPAFLISEAVRGEGAVLVRADGSSFMDGYHPQGSLAPRDVVARAIDRELKASGADHVRLDVSAIPSPRFSERFPGTVAGLRERGIDPHVEGIPVVPAAHYLCGGVRTDLQGRSSLDGLYAVGEVAATGLHGANRLASNSLLEALVFSHRAAQAVRARLGHPRSRTRDAGVPRDGASDGSGALELEPIENLERRVRDDLAPSINGSVEGDRERVRTLMWEQVGIVRSDARLGAAGEEIRSLRLTHGRRWLDQPWSSESAELRNLLQVAELIVTSALGRRESRGLHFTIDHPHRDNESFLCDSTLRRGRDLEQARDGAGSGPTRSRDGASTAGS